MILTPNRILFNNLVVSYTKKAWESVLVTRPTLGGLRIAHHS